MLPLYWWLTTSTSTGSPPATAYHRVANDAVVVMPEETAVVMPEETAVVVPAEAVVVVMAEPRGLRGDERRRGGDVGWAHGRGCGVGRGCGTEQKRAGDGACAHCACC